jgi:O-acetyl-ADP-ribose deacetylase (regulator of RNase III)
MKYMEDRIEIAGKPIRLFKGDIADLEIECFVYYAQHDLKLGSGIGNAISMRGGRSIQEELEQLGPLETTEVVLSQAGEMKVKSIMHAVGPRFLEENLEEKLWQTMRNCLQLAADKGIKQIAFPAMGVGFYGVPLESCAEIMLNTISEFLMHDSSVNEVIICVIDNRELRPFQAQISAMGATKEKV